MLVLARLSDGSYGDAQEPFMNWVKAVSEPGEVAGPPCSGTAFDWLSLSPSLATQPSVGIVSKLRAPSRWFRCKKSNDALPGTLSPWLTLRNSQSEPALEALTSQLCLLRALPPHLIRSAPSQRSRSSWSWV